MERDYHGQRWSMWLLWREGVKLLDIHHQLPAVCGEKARYAALCSWVWSFNRGKESAQVAVREWYYNTVNE
jgi:hypothetical protein